MDNDSLAERGRALEDDYFRKKDRELIERIAAAVVQAGHRSAAPARLADPGALQELHDLGFSLETVGLLPLIPALQAAWIEGGVTAAERQLFLGLARARGIPQGSAADDQLTEWVGRRPDDAVFSHARRLIRALLDAAPGSLHAEDIVSQADQIAAAGSILGLSRLSTDEKAQLTQLAQLRRRGGS